MKSPPKQTRSIPTGGVGADHGGAGEPREDLVEGGGGGVGEVDDHAQLGEPVDERAAQPGEPTALGCAVRVGVAPVPRQPGHPHPELPERFCRPQLVAELLDPLEREHQPDPLTSLDRSEVGRRPNLRYPVTVLSHGAEEAGGLPERLSKGSLRLPFELDEDGAHLEADVPCLEQRQPGAGERAGFAEAELAVAELEQQVEVGLSDHRHESDMGSCSPPIDISGHEV